MKKRKEISPNVNTRRSIDQSNTITVIPSAFPSRPLLRLPGPACKYRLVWASRECAKVRESDDHFADMPPDTRTHLRLWNGGRAGSVQGLLDAFTLGTKGLQRRIWSLLVPIMMYCMIKKSSLSRQREIDCFFSARPIQFSIQTRHPALLYDLHYVSTRDIRVHSRLWACYHITRAARESAQTTSRHRGQRRRSNNDANSVNLSDFCKEMRKIRAITPTPVSQMCPTFG